MTAQRQTSHGTDRVLLIAGIAAAVIILYRDSFQRIYELWQLTDYRHGILVLPISAFLLWRIRRNLAVLPLLPALSGLLLLAGIAGMWVVAQLVGIQVLEHTAALALIPAAVFALLGLQVTHKALFPLVFVLFAVPLGDSLVPYLMVITADTATALLRVSGIPVFREGQYISLSGGNFVVADVCSGLRYLIAGTMISLLYAYLSYESVIKRAVFVLCTGVVLVMANGLRAYIVMAVASASDMRYLGGRDHIYFGWLLFGVVIMVALWVGAKYADTGLEESNAGNDVPVGGHTKSPWPLIIISATAMLAVTVVQFKADIPHIELLLVVAAGLLAFVLSRGSGDGKESSPEGYQATRVRGTPQIFVSLAGTALILMGAPAVLHTLTASDERSAPFLVSLAFDGCAEPQPWSSGWRPNMPGAAIERAESFGCGKHGVNVYRAVYANALQGEELVGNANSVIPEAWARYTRRQPLQLALGNDRQATINEVLVDAPGRQRLVSYWYEIDGRVATTEVGVKALQVLAFVTGRPAGGSIVLIEIPFDESYADAKDLITNIALQILATESARQGSSDAGQQP